MVVATQFYSFFQPLPFEINMTTLYELLQKEHLWCLARVLDHEVPRKMFPYNPQVSGSANGFLYQAWYSKFVYGYEIDRKLYCVRSRTDEVFDAKPSKLYVQIGRSYWEPASIPFLFLQHTKIPLQFEKNLIQWRKFAIDLLRELFGDGCKSLFRLKNTYARLFMQSKNMQSIPNWDPQTSDFHETHYDPVNKINERRYELLDNNQEGSTYPITADDTVIWNKRANMWMECVELLFDGWEEVSLPGTYKGWKIMNVSKN